MSSFFWPNPATEFMSAVDRGLTYDDGSGLSADFGEAQGLLHENFAAFEDYTATQATALLTGTLDGAGAATIPHLIGQPFGLLVVQAWCKGATAADFGPVTVDSVGATNVVLSAGTAGQPVRVFLMFSIVPPGW